MCIILFCTFIVLNLCKADSKGQHQNPILIKHHSIAVVKFNTTETLVRVYEKSCIVKYMKFTNGNTALTIKVSPPPLITHTYTQSLLSCPEIGNMLFQGHLTLSYPNFQLSVRKPTLSTPFKPVVLGFLLFDLSNF